jgi:parallel beta-helix repeat protein
MKPFAFLGSAAGVHLSNLIVEKYATPAHFGAVGANKAGAGWVINHIEARWNHGYGIEVGSDSQILNSFAHHNGQQGLNCGPVNCRVIKNELSWNNYAGFAIDDDAGGAKFGRTTNLFVQSNYVHDNQATGLWDDTDCVGTVFDGNTVINNLGEGIQHEISYNAVISNNIVKGNGNISTSGLWNAQILLQASSNVEVYGNTVEVSVRGGNGIVLMNEKRGSGIQGAYVAANNRVHNNTITYLGANGYSGIDDSREDHTAVGNSFYSNRYIFVTGSSNSAHWMWPWPVPMNWKAFQATGQEVHGTCCS